MKLGAKTTWLKAVEVLVANLESPLYAAVIECVPTVSVEVVNVATAPLVKARVPSEAVPSRNVTIPVGIPEVEEVTVAVNVTGLSLDAEMEELTNATVVGAVTAGVMVSITAVEVLLAKFALPAYLQMIECVPTVSVDVIKVATALLLSVPVPSVAVPSRKVMLPVGVPEPLDVMVAVNVSGLPLDAEAAEATMVAVVAAAAAGVMVSVKTGEVLLAKFPLPL